MAEGGIVYLMTSPMTGIAGPDIIATSERGVA